MGGSRAQTSTAQTSTTTSYSNSFNETFNNIFSLDNVASQNVSFGNSDGMNVMLIVVVAAFVAVFAISKR